MNSIPYSGFRRSIGEYVHLAGRYAPIVCGIDINCSGLKEFCAASGLTYTPVFLKAIAGVAREKPVLNTILSRAGLRRKIFLPDEIDIAVAIEKQWRGETFVTTPMVRDAGSKTLKRISADIDALAAMPVDEMPDIRQRLLLNRLPGVLQYLVMYCTCQSPRLFQRYYGTIGFTNLGKSGISEVYPVWLNTAVFGMASILDRPVAVAGAVIVAPVVHLTINFNHCVMDGTAAADILARIKHRIESRQYTQEPL